MAHEEFLAGPSFTVFRGRPGPTFVQKIAIIYIKSPRMEEIRMTNEYSFRVGKMSFLATPETFNAIACIAKVLPMEEGGWGRRKVKYGLSSSTLGNYKH